MRMESGQSTRCARLEKHPKDKGMTENSKERPFKPSWVDRLTDWVARLPVPGWAFYAGLASLLILIQVLFLWLDGGLDAAEVLLPLIVFNALFPYLLGLMHLLDRQAVAALNSMRPTLEMSGQEFDEFEHALSNMPSRPPLVAGLALLVSYLIMEQLGTTPVRFAALEQLPTFSIVFHIVDKAPTFVFGAFFYHTVRQLRLVDSINSNYTRISLLDLGPLRAFSRLTASTAVGLVVGFLGWMLINPELLADPVSVGFAAAYTIMAAAVFVWPQWGVHRLMQMEKERALHEVGLRFEAVLGKFNQLIDDGDYAAAESLNGTIASLEIQHRRISAIPTWPWRPELARIVLTAIASPLILMIVQYFVFQALGR
jgi:hypothetical protein